VLRRRTRAFFQAPFRAGIRLDAYQLEPLRKALLLPRVNLLIADDVGLGKTIEAGLILRELLLRRRIDFVVVAAPPSMLGQWADGLETRFGLRFTIARLEHAGTLRLTFVFPQVHQHPDRRTGRALSCGLGLPLRRSRRQVITGTR